MNYLIAILITLLFSAFFSGMEIAFVSSNKLRIEIDKKQGSFSSQIISIFTQNPGQYIVTMLIGNNIALVIYGIIMALVLEPLIRTFTQSDSTILIIQTIISTLLILFTAEFLPKVVFRINSNGLLKVFSIPIFLFYLIFYPISKFTIALSNLILRVFLRTKISKNPAEQVFGKPDLDHLVNQNESIEDSQEEKDAGIKMFQNALDFSNVKLRECMIPRTEIVALEEGVKIDELRQAFIETGFSKVLIFKESIDNIVGYVNMKDLLGEVDNISTLILPLPIVPESMPANKLLKLFVEEKKNIALVVDEFGGTSGIVTIEDILEEIFGEIEDEHDISELVDKQISDTEYLFSARLEIDFLNEKYNLNLPEMDNYETLAGLIFFHLESIPKLNQTITIDQFEFKVIKVSETRLELVHLKVIES